MDRIQKLLLQGIASRKLGAVSILEIGCGVGTLHRELLSRGAQHAVGVDMSDGMLSEARRFAAEAGLGERTTYIQGDFTALADTLPRADLTVLDKVVCCYPEVERLLDLSTALTGSTYAVSFPRDRLGMRLAFAMHRLLGRVLGWEFYPCWHVWADVRERIERAGFAPSFQGRSFLWEAVVYGRGTEAEPG